MMEVANLESRFEQEAKEKYSKQVSHSVREGKGFGYQCHNPRASWDLITFSLPPNISEILLYPFNKLSFYSRNSLNGFASLATQKP